MKRLLFPLATLLLLVVGVVFGFVWWTDNSAAVSASQDKIRFVIPKGHSASQIAIKLHQTGLIKSPFAFKFYVQVNGKTKELKPGEFTLSKNMVLSEVVAKLLKGPDEIWVTIPEGLRREEVAMRAIKQLELADGVGGFYSEFMRASDSKEGYLFPDTYLFPKDIGAQRVVEMMETTFDAKYEALLDDDNNRKVARTKSEIVKMASIIEREAITNEERPVIAGILWKRLDTAGWLIQADATIQYFSGAAKCPNGNTSLDRCSWSILENDDWWPILTKEDLETDTLYSQWVSV